MIRGLVFFIAGQKCHIGKIPFSELEAKSPSGTFRKSIIYFFILSTHFIQLFWLRCNCCLTLILFQTHMESGKHENSSQKTQMKKIAKNGKIDLCSANYRICNIRYFLIKFSGYIAYDMQFHFLYCFVKPLIYEYLIFTFISDEFLRNSQNMGTNGENTPSWWARQAQVVWDICLKFGHYSHQNKSIIGIEIRA